MVIVHVHVKVKLEYIEDFKKACIDNASQSFQEPGIARFDILQQSDDPSRFILVEVYRNEQAPAHHKATTHYAKWRDAVEVMMAEPRFSVKYTNIYPLEQGWG
jgi:quinol monooxygenase YgiN